ncbi:hypothetical protein [Marinoscillum pacificum]|uniref:hypothetical protein n=1 Tax=Marinoscillum pacificum TaxID=392723 RepID=UPI002157617A|nr:hypothetical protein [Marinoscillum pacificum]
MKFRIYHRYLGFFLVGIMAVYALSGIVLVFRDKDIFKKEKVVEKELPVDTPVEKLGEALRIRNLKVEKEEGGVAYFEQGNFDTKTGKAVYTVKELPYLLDRMTHMHKATSSRPLAFLNVFFGLSLLFFVVSSFWMFSPGTSIFKKGLYFTAAGLVLTILLILF